MKFGAAILGAALCALAAIPAAAQQGRAQVVVQARLTIPDVLLLSEAGRTDAVDAQGRTLTRATLRVTANRRWALGLAATDLASIEEVRVNGQTVDPRSAVAQGSNGNDQPVVLEIKWKAGTASDPRRLQYELSAS